MKRLVAASAVVACTAGLAVGAIRYRAEVLRLMQQIPPFREYWFTRPQIGDITYLALGDSSGVGIGADRPEDGYVGVLADRLAEWHGGPVAVRNLSVAGSTIQNLLDEQIDRFADLQRPDICTVFIGANDAVLTGFTQDAFRAKYERLVNALPPGSFVAELPSLRIWPFEPRVRAANRIIRELVAKHGHRLVPMHSITGTMRPLQFLSLVNGDFFHPNRKGYVRFADAFWSEIKPILDGMVSDDPSAG